MDLATLIGVVGGFALVIFGIVTGEEGVAALGSFYDFSSVLITFGGSIASVLVSHTIKDFVSGLKGIKLAFQTTSYNIEDTIKQIIDLSNVARKEGLLALEEAAEGIEDPFMKKGILLIVDGTDAELIKGVLETELNCMEERHEKVIGFWSKWAEFGPAWGMIGTLIGLINMLKQLNDPTKIGGPMATALVTTFYGSMIANWLATPIANKLRVNNDAEVEMKAIMIEGLLSIHAGENPRVIEEKLKSFLSPAARDAVNEPNEGGE